MKRPLVFFTLIFCFGIFLADKIRIPFIALYVVAWIFSISTILFPKSRLISGTNLSLAIFFLGCAFLSFSRTIPPNHILRLLSYRGDNFYLVRGVIITDPEIKENSVKFIFRIEEIQKDKFRYKTCGFILVKINLPGNFSYGEELILNGRLRRPFVFKGGSTQSYKEYLSRQGIYLLMDVKRSVDLIRLNKNKGSPVKRFSFVVKNKMEGIIFRYLSKLSAGIVDAMVLGERSGVPQLISNSMIKTGTVHILAWQYTKLSNCTFPNNITL